MTGQAHWDYQVAKTPVKAALRRVHAVERVEALSIGEPTVHGSETVADRLEEVEGLTAALDAAARCRRCGKRLTQPRCRRRRFGDDCWAVELAAGRVVDDGDNS